MEHLGPPSDNTHPGSEYRLFKYPRKNPTLPTGYDWTTQKQRYSPCDLLLDSRVGRPELKSNFGYVFCHRGLYERASRIPENSSLAIENGIRQGLFLHEVDAIVLESLYGAFVAHDKIARRVTAKKEPWGSYPLEEILKTPLVTRRVETALMENGSEKETPDFASSYLETREKVLGLFNTLWEEKFAPAGRTLQIDLRDMDFAKAISYYSFHISKRKLVEQRHRGAHNTLVWNLFRSTILKGYNVHFKSFDHLEEVIKENSENAYRWNFYDTKHLYLLPPLIMVFFAQPLIDLASETEPVNSEWDKQSYEHIRDTVMKQVSSFIGLVDGSYNFILEIAHSGLGLGYDVTTRKAKDPLNGDDLTDKEVIFESLVDRAMIDVSLELREKHPQLLFSSCTRLPDVITSEGNFKAEFKTSRLGAWKDGEKGLSTKLRSIHGGLYPQSHLVVADDPIAEIAARTWIDEKIGLNRSELLRLSYDKWLANAGKDVVTAMEELNNDFLPNKYGGVVDPALSHLDTIVENPVSGPIDSIATVTSWLREMSVFPDRILNPDIDRQMGRKQSEDNKAEEVTVQNRNVSSHDLHFAPTETARNDSKSDSEVNSEIDEGESDSSADSQRVVVKIANKMFVFDNLPTVKRTVSSLSAYKAAEEGDEEAIRKLLLAGKANINASTGVYGTALGVACAKGHATIVKLLLNEGADGIQAGEFDSPLELASAAGYVAIVEMLFTMLIKSTADADTLAKEFNAALQQACKGGHDAVVQLLLDKGADVNYQGGQYHTALQAACVGGHDTTVQLLLDNGADVNVQGGRYHTPLQAACEKGNINIINMLLDKEADVNAIGGLHGTAFRAACARGNHSTINLLLDKGANLQLQPERGQSVLHIACEREDASLVKLLLEKGVEIDVPVGRFSPAIRSILVEAGGDINDEAGAYEFQETRRRAEAKASWKKRQKNKRNIEKQIKTHKRYKRRFDKRRKEEGYRPLKVRSCGCLLCYIDQVNQPRRPGYNPNRVYNDDSVAYTLKQMNQPSGCIPRRDVIAWKYIRED